MMCERFPSVLKTLKVTNVTVQDVHKDSSILLTNLHHPSRNSKAMSPANVRKSNMAVQPAAVVGFIQSTL